MTKTTKLFLVIIAKRLNTDIVTLYSNNNVVRGCVIYIKHGETFMKTSKT